MPSRRGGVLGGPLAAIAWTLLLLGLPLVLLLSSPYTRLVAGAFDPAGRTGLDERVALREAERVRGFVAGSVDELPETVDGRRAFGAEEVSHLADVRAVLRQARLATLVALTFVVAWTAWAVRLGKRKEAASAMTAGALTLIAAAAVALVAALVDFDAFFAFFHGMFFASGTWLFPEDALLIELFPLAFWMAALSLAGAGVLLAFARKVGRETA